MELGNVTYDTHMDTFSFEPTYRLLVSKDFVDSMSRLMEYEVNTKRNNSLKAAIDDMFPDEQQLENRFEKIADEEPIGPKM